MKKNTKNATCELSRYRDKRDFERTPEPRGAPRHVTLCGVCEASAGFHTEEEIAMRRRMFVILVMALALVHVVPVAAGQAMGNAKATLTGDAEVPGPGDPKGSGTVVVTLKPDTISIRESRAKRVPSPCRSTRPRPAPPRGARRQIWS